MCVIFATQETRPTAAQVKAAYESNPRGAGIAYRTEENGVKGVRWKKGMNLEQAQAMAEKAPLPYVLHFRIPSVGPDKPQFNHPFVIGPNADIATEGFTASDLLFHNGTWQQWRSEMPRIAMTCGEKIPLNPWSDSRAMAFAAYCAGLGFLTFLDERVVVFGPNILEIFSPNSWSRVASGLWASNMGWQSSSRTSYTGSASTNVGGAKKSAEVLLPDEETESKTNGTPLSLIALTGQPGGADRKAAGFRPSNASDGGVAEVQCGGDQQVGLQGSEEAVHAAVVRTQPPPTEDLAQEQGTLRAWIASLNPKRFTNHVH